MGFTGARYYPDVSIEVNAGDGLTRLILLDAKYRVEEDRGCKQDDVDKMHTYRDALTRDGMRVESAFILYPGEELFDPAGGAVGAIPLKPGLSQHALDLMLGGCLRRQGLAQGGVNHAAGRAMPDGGLLPRLVRVGG